MTIRTLLLGLRFASKSRKPPLPNWSPEQREEADMRIGVVGAGKIGSMRVQTVKENSETELAAVLDINPALAEQAVAGTSAPALTELNAFLKSPMDAVVVSTPPHLHEDACIGAFKQGRHVL